jgi:hypothetical protein
MQPTTTRSAMKGLLCGLILSTSLGLAAQSAAYTRVDLEEVVAALKAEGFAGSKVPEGKKYVQTRMEGVIVSFTTTDNHNLLQAYAGFKSDKVNLEKLNKWNASKRFTRAYIDAEGDPCIELDYSYIGGVTKENLADFFDTVRIQVTAFRTFVNQ